MTVSTVSPPASSAARASERRKSAKRSSGPQPQDGESLPIPAIRYALIALISGLLLTDRVAVSVGSLPLGLTLPLTYVLLLVMLLNNKLAVDLRSVLFYAATAAIGFSSYLFNANLKGGNSTSLSSLMLLLAIYLPFVFVMVDTPENRGQWRWMMRIMSNVLLIIAFAGILQFYAQFVISEPWLFNASQLLPDAIRGQGIYNSEIRIGSFAKANGFVSREPSGFSYLMALGLLIEFALFKRVKRALCFGLGLILSYSGTGILILAVGLLLPFRAKVMLWLGLACVVAALGNAAAGDPFNLAFTLSRFGEFSAPGSSAYARYVAPMLLVDQYIDSTSWSVWLGHGPGMIFRMSSYVEFHDPTWAKLLVEYGLTGFIVVVAFVCYKLAAFPAPFQFRAVLFASWLVTGGQLLAPENVCLLFVMLGVWPRPAHANTAARPWALPPKRAVQSQPVRKLAA